jgi:YVTN family beta-propeller protein
MSLVATVPVGRDPVDIDGPRHLVLDPSAELAYVALSYPESELGAHAAAAGQNGRSGYVEALNLSDLSVAGDLRLDPSTSEVGFSNEAGMLAATHFDKNRATLSVAEARRANLVLIQPARAIASAEATPRRIPVCAVPGALAFNADGSRVFIACSGDDTLAVVDTESGDVLSQVPVGSAPANKPIALSGDGARERVLVSNEVSTVVSMFDMADTPSLLATLRVPGVPRFATWISDGVIGVPHEGPNGVTLFDAATGDVQLDVVYTNEECEAPAELTTTHDGRLLLVCTGTKYTPGSVVELDPETLGIVSSVEVGRYPERLTISEP